MTAPQNYLIKTTERNQRKISPFSFTKSQTLILEAKAKEHLRNLIKSALKM